MGLLLGTFEHQLDAKNRIRIPAKLRCKFLENETLFYVLYGNGRISVMSSSVLDRKLETIDGVTPDDEKGSDATTKIYSSISEVVEDGQGRTMIPRFLREAANIKKDVVTIGKRDFVEIWAKEEFDSRIGSMTMREANAMAYGRGKAEEQ